MLLRYLLGGFEITFEHAFMTDYVKDTRESYKDKTRAEEYRNYYTKGISWIRLTMNIERSIVRTWLRDAGYASKSLVLDAPCGTGLMGEVLSSLGIGIVASDISGEMIQCAQPDYTSPQFKGFIRADNMILPFNSGTFDCVLTLGLLHRLPDALRDQAIVEICRVSKKHVLVSYSLDSVLAKLKRKALALLPIRYGAPPCPTDFSKVLAPFEAAGFKLIRRKNTVPFLSSDNLLMFSR